MLPVTTYGVNTFFGFVANGGDFVCLNVSFDYFGRNLVLVESWSTDLRLIAVDDQQRHEIDGLADLFDLLHLKYLAFRDEILLATGLDYCFFHVPIEHTKKMHPCKGLMN